MTTVPIAIFLQSCGSRRRVPPLSLLASAPDTESDLKPPAARRAANPPVHGIRTMTLDHAAPMKRGPMIRPPHRRAAGRCGGSLPLSRFEKVFRCIRRFGVSHGSHVEPGLTSKRLMGSDAMKSTDPLTRGVGGRDDAVDDEAGEGFDTNESPECQGPHLTCPHLTCPHPVGLPNRKGSPLQPSDRASG